MVAQSTVLRRNIIALWTAFAVRILLALVFVPVITRTLGPSGYGIWGIIFQIINYLALLDFGFEKAIINFVASAIGRKDHLGASRVIRTSVRLYFWFGLAAVLVAAVIALALLPNLKIESGESLVDAQIALVIIGVFSGIRFWFTPISAALSGFQRYDRLTIIQVTEDALRTIAMILLLTSGFGLVALASCVLVFGLARQLISVWWLKRTFPDWRWRVEPEAELRDQLFSYSRITFAITLVWMVIFNTDSLLLGFFASTAAAGVYNPATQLAGYMRHLVNAVGTPLTAAAAHAHAASNLEPIKRQYLRLFGYASYGGFAVTALVAAFASPLVKLWLPAGFEETSRVMIILAVGSAVFIPHILSNAMLFAVNQHRLLLYAVIAEAALKIGLAAVLIGRMGGVGMAYANSVPQILIYTSVFPFLVGRALGVSPVHLLWSQFKAGLVALIFTMIPGLLINNTFAVGSWSSLVLAVGAVSLCAVTGVIVVLNPDDRRRVIVSLRRSLIS